MENDFAHLMTRRVLIGRVGISSSKFWKSFESQFYRIEIYFVVSQLNFKLRELEITSIFPGYAFSSKLGNIKIQI